MIVSKKVLLYVGLAAYVFLLGIMGFVLSQQLGDKSTLAAELDATHNNIDTLNPENLEKEKSGFEDQLSEISTQIDSLIEIMSPEIGNVDASAMVFEIAKNNNVEIVELSSPHPSEEIFEEIPCDVVLLNATVVGSVHDLIDFISRMNTTLDTGVIQSIDMNIQYGENQSSSYATIFMQVYNYRGE